MGKARPSPPHWYWADSDGCWDYKNRNNCNGCKRMKIFARNKTPKDT